MVELPELPKLKQGGDLLKQVKVERQPLPKGFFKLLATEFFAVLLAALTGWVYSRFLHDTAGMYTVFAFAAVWFAVSGLAALLATGIWRRILVGALEAAAFVAPVYDAPMGYLLSAWGVLLLFLILGDVEARREYENTLKFRFNLFGKLKFGKMLTGVLLSALVIYIPHASGKPFISGASFKSLYAGVASAAKVAYPDLDLNANVDRFTKQLVKNNLMADPDFQRELPDVQDKQIAAAAAEMQVQAEKTLGIKLAPDTALSDVFYVYLANMASGVRSFFGGYFNVFWALLLFIIIRGIGVIFVWLAQVIGFLLYESLVATGVLAVLGESRTKESVIFT